MSRVVSLANPTHHRRQEKKGEKRTSSVATLPSAALNAPSTAIPTSLFPSPPFSLLTLSSTLLLVPSLASTSSHAPFLILFIPPSASSETTAKRSSSCATSKGSAAARPEATRVERRAIRAEREGREEERERRVRPVEVVRVESCWSVSRGVHVERTAPLRRMVRRSQFEEMEAMRAARLLIWRRGGKGRFRRQKKEEGAAYLCGQLIHRRRGFLTLDRERKIRVLPSTRCETRGGRREALKGGRRRRRRSREDNRGSHRSDRRKRERPGRNGEGGRRNTPRRSEGGENEAREGRRAD